MRRRGVRSRMRYVSMHLQSAQQRFPPYYADDMPIRKHRHLAHVLPHQALKYAQRRFIGRSPVYILYGMHYRLN